MIAADLLGMQVEPGGAAGGAVGVGRRSMRVTARPSARRPRRVLDGIVLAERPSGQSSGPHLVIISIHIVAGGTLGRPPDAGAIRSGDIRFTNG